MNFFFLTSKKDYIAKLAIPKFQNSGNLNNNLRLYEANIVENRWVITEPENCYQTNKFWHLECKNENDSVFFLGSDTAPQKIVEKNLLCDLNNFTNTSPDFRANLMLKNKLGGFSSYQSEYPFRMTAKLGSFYSDCGLLTSEKGSKVGLFIKNIFSKPIIEERELFLFDVRNNSILEKFKVSLNKTNFLDLTKYKEKLSNCFLVAKDYLGIPIYLVEYDDGSLSFEHTHPPHESILGSERYHLVNQLKEKAFDEITKVGF